MYITNVMFCTQRLFQVGVQATATSFESDTWPDGEVPYQIVTDGHGRLGMDPCISGHSFKNFEPGHRTQLRQAGTKKDVHNFPCLLCEIQKAARREGLPAYCCRRRHVSAWTVDYLYTSTFPCANTPVSNA